jgi:hypothetical protein
VQSQSQEPARLKKAQVWRSGAESPDDGGPWLVVSRRRIRSMRGHRGALRARALIDALNSSEIVSSIVSVTSHWRQKSKMPLAAAGL